MQLARFAVRGIALAIALACSHAQAGITASGSVNAYPGNAPIGPGDTDLGNVGLFVGNGAPGSLTADGGSLLRTGSLLVGPGPSGNGDGAVLITGAGTRVELTGDGFGDGVVNRLGVGEWGKGSLTVAAGAVLDGRVNGSACFPVTNHYCSAFIGNAAGSDGTLTVTGAGSQASFLRFFGVGGLAVFHPPIDNFTFGTPGGTTTGRVNVLAGGTLVTDVASLGLAPGGSAPTGSERSFAAAVVNGADSVWRITGGTVDPAVAPFFGTAAHRNAWATLDVTGGGTLRIEGTGNLYGAVNLTTGGGRTDALISGAGSNLTFAARSGVLNVARSLGSATLDVRDGGRVDHAFYVAVGRDGSYGTLNIDGAGSRVRIDNTATAAANGVTGGPFLDIGRNGTGVVNVAHGGRIDVLATTATANGPGMNLGRDAASSGTLNIDSGGVVFLSAASVAPDSSGEAFNPFVRIGRDGTGTLAIGGGGKLLVEGNAVSTPTNTRRTSLFIGGAGDAVVGGRGIATVTGLGSELRVSGSDAYIGVGHGPQAVGNLTVADRAVVGATILGIGNFGGTGVAKFDHATVELAGRYTGNGEFGAALVVGAGSGGVGNVSAVNGTTIRVATTAANGGGISVGGSRTVDGGDGTLTLNASSIVFDLPLNNGSLTVGRTGSGLLRMQSGSAIDLGGNALYVGRLSGADGTLIATGGSTIAAGWVGVGRNRAGGVDSDGGTGTMVLNGATLTAQTIVIGTNGYLGGSAGSIVGDVVNYGIFSPGASPGVFTIDGDYTAGAGSRLILEVQSDGHGGFLTDDVRFGSGHAVDLAGLKVEFRFLGTTDPNAFRASGRFDIDTFVRQAGAGGALAGLSDSAFAGVTFSARADGYVIDGFSYSPTGGAVFTATPVPEPASWLLLAGGALALGLHARRRRASA